MAAIKSYTDLEQSKRLAKILPLESADMFFSGWAYPKELHLPTFSKTSTKDSIPCWSLSALLDVLPKTINFGYENDSTFSLNSLENGKYLADYYEISYVKDNPVDACYEMILKLHELNLL